MIVDETLAREEAQRRNLSVIGTLPEAVSKLQKTNFCVASELVRSLLDEDAMRRKTR
jgi:hypothetical protein